MKIKDIIISAATLAGREDICNYLSDGYAEDHAAAKKDADIMLRCFNLVENEIALEYKPLIFFENVITDGGIINFDSLKKQITDVVKIEDIYGNRIKYRLFNTYLKTKPGEVVIYYSCIPEKKGLEDSSDYKESEMPLRVMAEGVACEFSLVSALYDEAVLWDKRYKDSLLKICSKKTDKPMPARRWI